MGRVLSFVVRDSSLLLLFPRRLHRFLSIIWLQITVDTQRYKWGVGEEPAS